MISVRNRARDENGEKHRRQHRNNFESITKAKSI